MIITPAPYTKKQKTLNHNRTLHVHLAFGTYYHSSKHLLPPSLCNHPSRLISSRLSIRSTVHPHLRFQPLPFRSLAAPTKNFQVGFLNRDLFYIIILHTSSLPSLRTSLQPPLSHCLYCTLSDWEVVVCVCCPCKLSIHASPSHLNLYIHWNLTRFLVICYSIGSTLWHFSFSFSFLVHLQCPCMYY